MRGWIYVISNKSMPGLVKVGYSSKDPEERVQGFDNTGTPHPYIVEYDILVEGKLYEIEQRIHRSLSYYLEGKEWFRCTPEQAVMKIREITKGIAIAESFKKADREKAERLEHERNLELARQREKTKKEEETLQHKREIDIARNVARQRREAKLIEKEREITQQYEHLSKEKFPTHGIKSFLISWLGFSILLAPLSLWMFPEMTRWAIVICGFGLAILFTLIWNERQKNKQTKWVESAKHDSWLQTRAVASERLKQIEGNVDPSDVRYIPGVQKVNIEEVYERMGGDKKYNGERFKGVQNVKVGVRVTCSKCFKQYSVSLARHENRAICPFCGGLTDVNIE